MNTCKKLPKSHKGGQIACLELERSKLLSRLIKIISVVLALALFGLGCIFLPPNALSEMDDPFSHLVVLMFGLFTVILVHELLRGLFMRLLSGVKPVIRFAGSYPHAGCEAYFDKTGELLICLAPLVIGTAILLVLLFTTADLSWRWMVWMMLIVNVCSCVGDVYVSLRLRSYPEDALIQNIGSTYLVYSAQARPAAE